MKRFWDKVNKTSDCWNWTAYTDKNGYGRFSVVNGKPQKAHRVSYEMHNGPIPENLFVLHSCKQNRACVNPSHLRLGTQKENMQDRKKDGTGINLRGENHPNTSLCETDVKFIRLWLKEGYTQRMIAKAFDISQVTIKNINKGITWGWLK